MERTNEKCLDDLREKYGQYNSSSGFIQNNIKLYIKLLSKGLRKEFLEITGWRDIVPWSRISEADAKRVLVASVVNHKTARLFERDSPGKYLKAQELGVWKEMMVSGGWTIPENWSDMRDDEAKELVARAAKKHDAVGAFQKHASRYYKKAIELGCLVEVTAHMTSGKLPFNELTYEEKKKVALEVAFRQKNIARWRSNYPEKHKFLKEEGLLEDAFRHLKYTQKTSKQNYGLKEKAKELAPKEPKGIKTLAEAVAYGMLCLTTEEYGSYERTIKFEYIENFFGLLQKPLGEVDRKWFEEQFTDYGTRRVIANFALREAVMAGALVDPLLFDSTALKSSHLVAARNHMESLNIKWQDKVMGRALTICSGDVKIGIGAFLFAWTFKEKQLDEIDDDLLDNFVFEEGALRRTLNLRKNRIVNELIVPFIQKGWMEDIYASTSERKKRIVEEALAGEKDNVFYYVAKLHEGVYNKKTPCLSHLIKAKEVFEAKKTSEFTIDDYNIEKMDTVKIKQVYRLMVKDGVASSDLLDNRDEGYVFDDDVWYVDGRELKFSKIKNDDFRYIMKTYFDKVYLQETAAKGVSLPTHMLTAVHLESFLGELGILQWKEFTNIKKQMFYDRCNDLRDSGKEANAKAMVLLLRAVIGKVKPLLPEWFDPHVAIHKGEFRMKASGRSSMVLLSDDNMKAIISYIQKGAGERTKERLFDIATVLQLMTFRRVSEIVNMKTDTLRLLGSSNEKILSYYSEKKKKMEVVSLASLKGERKDPFALVMDDLVPSLLDEAIKITQVHRDVVVPDLKEYIFLEESASPGKKGLYYPISTSRLSDRLVELRKILGLPDGFTGHQSRHSGATRLIRSGSSIALVAAALGDGIETTMKSYIDTVSQRETMALKRGALITTIEDTIKEIILTKYPGEPKPMTDEQAAEFGDAIDVVGGKCMGGASVCFSCKAFRQTSGNSGCKGCALYTPTTGNLPYWKLKYQKSSMSLARYRGTGFSEHLFLECQRDENIVKRLEELADEYC